MHLTEQDVISQLPETYMVSLVHATSRMRIHDELVWSRLAAHLASVHTQLNLRSLSTVVYSLTQVSRLKPVILNFDDLFEKLELSLIKRFNTEVDPQAISNTLLSYSKS